MEERKEEDAYLVTGNIKHFPEKPWKIRPNCVPNPARLRVNLVKLRKTILCGEAAI